MTHTIMGFQTGHLAGRTLVAGSGWRTERRTRGIMTELANARRIGIVAVTAILVAVAVLPMSGAAAVPDSQKWAVLVGISDYSDECGYGDLSWCHKDVADMYRMLIVNGWSPSHIRVLVNDSATYANIVAAIGWLKEVSAKGMALFYYSGHGSFFSDKWSVPNKDEPADQCIVPYDGDTGSYSNLLFDDTMKVLLSGFKSDQLVIMLDSCYSGGFIDECGAAGRLIMAACEAHEMSYEGGNKGSNVPLQNGVYTYCVLQALSGLGDANGNGIVSLEEAAQYATIHARGWVQSMHGETYDGVSGEVLL